MATPRRRPDASVIDALVHGPRRFSFFQAVRLLERRAAGGALVGGDHDPRDESVRFHSGIHLGFPAAEIQSLHQDDDGRAHLELGFFGLTGPLGALPEGHSGMVGRALREKQPELREFLDIFNHRLTSLFYRAWAKYRPAPALERAKAEGRPDPVSELMAALVGLGGESLRDRMAVPDSLALHHAGPLSRRIRPAAVVEDLLSAALDLTVRVEQFRGAWCPLPDSERTVLPGPDTPQGRFCRLGVDMVAGARAWEVMGGIRLHVGPLGLDDFMGLLPGTPGAEKLADMVALVAGLSMDFDVRLVLRPDQVPPLRLGGGQDGPRLGWTTWLPGGAMDQARDVLLRPC